MITDFFSLFFPNNCAACNAPLLKNENTICISCQYELPQTGFHQHPENPISKLFWGKVNISAATSLYFFNRGSKVQRLMHQLKYNGNHAVGIALGKQIGFLLQESSQFKELDGIVPVPLHPKKQRQRGYNQCQYLAEGIADSTGIPVLSCLKRTTHSESQTRKSKFNRWKNVDAIFTIKKEEEVCGKHLLLVDDVVTTGATLEACSTALLKASGVKVSIATIACA